MLSDHRRFLAAEVPGVDDPKFSGKAPRSSFLVALKPFPENGLVITLRYPHTKTSPS